MDSELGNKVGKCFSYWTPAGLYEQYVRVYGFEHGRYQIFYANKSSFGFLTAATDSCSPNSALLVEEITREEFDKAVKPLLAELAKSAGMTE